MAQEQKVSMGTARKTRKKPKNFQLLVPQLLSMFSGARKS